MDTCVLLLTNKQRCKHNLLGGGRFNVLGLDGGVFLVMNPRGMLGPTQVFESRSSSHGFHCVLCSHRMSKALTEADGPSWREKLPPIPTVPLSIREKLGQQTPNNILKPTPAPQQNGSREAKKKGEDIYLLHSDRELDL